MHEYSSKCSSQIATVFLNSFMTSLVLCNFDKHLSGTYYLTIIFCYISFATHKAIMQLSKAIA